MEIDLHESRHAFKWHCDEKLLRLKVSKGEPYTKVPGESRSLVCAKAGRPQLSLTELHESQQLVQALQTRSSELPALRATSRVLSTPSTIPPRRIEAAE
jgi:hypothetical protein